MSGQLFIGGTWRDGGGEAWTSRNPADRAEVWHGGAATPADVDAAVASARVAFDTWSARPVGDRWSVIERFCSLIEERKEMLAHAIGREMGKALWDARTEVGAMIRKGVISRQAYEERTGLKQSNGTRLEHRPHGVLAVFGPYNFPGHLPNGHVVPALLAGNCLVFKPSERTPGFGEAMVRLWQEAGLPAGVLNLVQGARATGEALAGHDDVDGILFTGSPGVGAALHRQVGGRPDKILALEMGGNNPLIVWDVANLDAAALTVAQSAFISAGQRCTCARRLIVAHGAAGDRLIDALAGVLPRLSVGAYDSEPPVFMGALVDAAAADALMRQAQARLQQGARWIVEASREDAFVTPGLLDVSGLDELPDEELFGPILQVQRAADFDTAIRLANTTRYGLAAGLLSDDRARWDAFYARARAGIVNWNRPLPGASSEAPFGGIGLSGNHRPSAYYAADYCAYPVASLLADTLTPPAPPPGLKP
ncbi:MAG: succinylglutamate-semialdehyde dehydrogenase [Rhodothalassiaceae bacterium]